jgi:hypothetical protein
VGRLANHADYPHLRAGSSPVPPSPRPRGAARRYGGGFASDDRRGGAQGTRRRGVSVRRVRRSQLCALPRPSRLPLREAVGPTPSLDRPRTKGMALQVGQRLPDGWALYARPPAVRLAPVRLRQPLSSGSSGGDQRPFASCGPAPAPMRWVRGARATPKYHRARGDAELGAHPGARPSTVQAGRRRRGRRAHARVAAPGAPACACVAGATLACASLS